MEIVIEYLLYIHIIAGTVSLLTGAVSLTSKKGAIWHRKSGKIYFYAMTVVFLTGIVIAGYRFNRFLFFIAFLSYYSVFSGIRFLRLKNLHRDQKPEWYDWMAGIVNGLANLFFLGLGVYYLVVHSNTGGGLLSIGFGLGGLLLSWVNMKPFIIRPDKAYHWYIAHLGNMAGGYIATFTAFLSTMVTRFDLMNPFLAFALPSIIGIPFLIYWTKRTERRFAGIKK